MSKPVRHLQLHSSNVALIEMPTRRKGDGDMEAASPALVQLVENNLLLHQAIADLKHIKAVQEMNHVVAVELRDHQTIERVDKLWLTVNNARWLLGGLAAILSGLFVTHAIWGWP